MIKSRDAIEKLFAEELKRLRTDHVDYYLMHMLTDTDTWARLEDLGIKEWLAAPGPALLDAAVDRYALPLPPGLTFMEGLGYCKGLSEQSAHASLDSVKRLLFGSRRLFR